tara:strand:+ start:462 stop:659 length:198 start_codon:yes stop_codon:yes gene_type:complete
LIFAGIVIATEPDQASRKDEGEKKKRMKYHSTRGGDIGLSFSSVLLRGLAEDGGLFVPDSIPEVL